MSFHRIRGILLQEMYITKRSVEVIVDLFYFAMINILVFGLFSSFLTGEAHQLSGQYLLLGSILWEIARVTQYTVSVEILWNVWSRNLSNMFISPLSIAEYLTAVILSGAIKSIIIFTTVASVAFFLFKFNILKIGILTILLSFINLSIFSWCVGIVVLGLIMKFGTRIQAFAWSLIFIFQPLTANLFPLHILPPFFVKLAYFLPPTYVFESARAALKDPTINWSSFLIAFLENIVYFFASLLFFKTMLRSSKNTGQFARNEG